MSRGLSSALLAAIAAKTAAHVVKSVYSNGWKNEVWDQADGLWATNGIIVATFNGGFTWTQQARGYCVNPPCQRPLTPQA